MAAELEKSNAALRYGTKGPDKWEFIQNGILDPKHDGTYHRFTIDGKVIDVIIQSARPVEFWQCPEHPEIAGDRFYRHGWEEAWELLGVGDGCHILGIYSPRSRKGVFHFWPIRLAGHRDCEDSRRDLLRFFVTGTNSDAMLALIRAMEHMVRGSALGGYLVDCEECWSLFRTLRQSCELP